MNMDKCSYPEGFEDFINARYAEPWFNEPHKFTHVRGIELARLAWLAATDRERRRCVEVTWSVRCRGEHCDCYDAIRKEINQ
ncbi:MAG TPA: hypothetical protein PLB01_00040 [Thermoanaerobaculia bacterium]|nr:hypothetical protein [Thermoanaerobaculia bacterium]